MERRYSMKATQFEFRFRLWISFGIYILGFWAPWLRYGKSAGPVSTTWLELSGELSHWMRLETASEVITITAIALAALGTVLRIWGTAHARGFDGTERLAHLGSARYLGALLFGLGISILMPPSGAVLFLVLGFIQLLRLAFREGAAEVAPKPLWGRALVAETFYVAMTVCFAVLAWRYNASLLIQALLICFGCSLVMRALVTAKS